ncbi:MAG: T9SS type A sorting domain-containing protein [Flavobacterium sp.]|nr:MAG: T9SS type A sorting domain-containing protein [Flavobacterium sp.]
MKKIFTLSILLCTGLSFAQLPDLQWGHSFGAAENDTATGMAPAPDGSLYVTGNFTGTVDFDPGDGVSNLTAEGMTDIFIQKFDATGNLLWVKKINNGTNTSSSQCVLDAQGNLLVTGTFRNTADLDPGAGVANFTATFFFDSFIIKLDSNGNYMWGKNIASGGDNSEWISTIVLDEAGNIYTTGYFYGTLNLGGTSFTSYGAYDSFIQKMDSSGNLIWAKRFGGNGYDGIGGFKLGTDGSMYIAGIFGDTADFDPGAGSFNITAQGFYDGFVMKLDNTGNFVWAKKIGGENIDSFSGLEINPDGNLILLGSFSSPSLTFNMNGANQTFTNNTNGAYNDVIVLEMDPSGNYIWGKSFGGTGDDSALEIIMGADGKFYILGIFNDTVDFNPADPVNTLTSAGLYDVFVMCLTNEGNYEYAHRIGGTGLDQARRMNYLNGSLYLTGTFKNTVNLNPSGPPLNATSAGADDFFICKFGAGQLGTKDFSRNLGITLHPNPSDGNFTIEGNGIENGQITIYNSLGSIMKQYNIRDEITNVLSAGVYFVEVNANGKREVKKLIVK